MKARDNIKYAICGERNIIVSKYKKNRKCKKRKYSVLKCGLLTVVALATLLGGIYSYFGGLGTGKCANVNEFEKRRETFYTPNTGSTEHYKNVLDKQSSI